MQVLVMAGGRGTRLGPYTATFPKPLVPIGDMPILELLLRQFKAAGVTEVILAVNHLHHLLRAFFGEGERLGMKISYSLEDSPLGTAGPIGLVRDELQETFFVSNGDLLTTLDFATMLAAHRAAGADATIASFRREMKSEFGVLETDAEMRMTGYLEKPVQTHLVSMGLYVLQRDAVVPHVTPGARLDMPDLMRALVAEGRSVLCHAPECFWLDIGRPDDYAQAQALFDTDRGRFLPDDQ
ncbi:NTP transferase domain-containing protein [Roseococcus sp. SDR]|uniref:sugar phosphate nucleotidyltransferase n=1 Tax=Roseococcus sp. SDR TaxID=2835532 RepID=UPI001BCBABAC|nr:sugar phosphate nucleotidyltransferase [Roseococcus sp. SDR]MBS7789694.1 NTP transferase domain-containing protein [Roseococcus sp. SDR]MBV1845008.1 NTP transferase domain-containing protein [Roseococcus sp. SDR]